MHPPPSPPASEKGQICWGLGGGCIVIYAGKSTGTNDRENNAEQLRSTSCIVASFRETNNSPLSAHIGGNRIGCPCDVVTLFAELNGGMPGSYSYEWTISLDGGVTYGSVQETASQFQTDLPCPNEGSYRVRLKVTAPNGQVVFTHWRSKCL